LIFLIFGENWGENQFQGCHPCENQLEEPEPENKKEVNWIRTRKQERSELDQNQKTRKK
jgi:hypothetical protein